MIDWNKAPEGATHYVREILCFYKMYDGVLMIYTRLLGWAESEYRDIDELSEEYDVTERPKQLVADTPKKHIHYDLIVQWASDPMQKVWCCHGKQWYTIESPTWNAGFKYHIGDTPPRETIRIGECDVPKPLSSHELVEGNVYHCPVVHLAGKASCKLYYLNVMGDCINLHLTKEDALLHSEALRSLTP